MELAHLFNSASITILLLKSLLLTLFSRKNILKHNSAQNSRTKVPMVMPLRLSLLKKGKLRSKISLSVLISALVAENSNTFGLPKLAKKNGRLMSLLPGTKSLVISLLANPIVFVIAIRILMPLLLTSLPTSFLPNIC